MADLNKPIVTDLFADVLTHVRDNNAALAKGLDPASVTVTNPPTNALRWELTTNKRLEKYNGASWVSAEPTAGYAINISGSAAKWTTGRTITFTGAATGASGAFDGSANISIALTQTTVPVNKGGTNITSYTVGDLLYASGATTLAKRAAVATGNVLLSGGVGAAPAWGKVVLTTHISGTLAIGNGGTGATTAAAARTALGVDAAMPSGTRMLFNQTTAPTGWTKDTTAALDNSALRIVTGTVGAGGSVAFTTAFASKAVAGTNASTTATGSVDSGGSGTSGATTLTSAMMPSHTHGETYGSGSAGTSIGATVNKAGAQTSASITTLSTGSGGSHTHTTPAHTHTFTGTSHTHTFTGTAINLAVKYSDVIIASKD